MPSDPHDLNADKPWLELAKLNQESRFNRRGFEWKLALEFWGFALGIPLLLRRLEISPDELHGIRCQVVCWYVLAGASFIASAIATHRAHDMDLEFVRFYTKRAIGSEAQEPAPNSCCCLATNSILWLVSKVCFTLAVLWASCKILLIVAATTP